MPDSILRELFERNARHVDTLPTGYFDQVTTGQEPPVVSVCCSDSRIPQEAMWAVDHPGWLFTPSAIGNQVWDRHEGTRVVDGSVLYPLVFTGTRVAIVVGHTGCGAVEAALDTVQNGRTEDLPRGIAKRVEMLVPTIEAGLEDDRVTTDPGTGSGLVNQLVEYNVDQQVEFLLASDDVPDDVTVYGFVYDFQGVYGDVPGRAYLVNADGDPAPEQLGEGVPVEFADAVHRLL